MIVEPQMTPELLIAAAMVETEPTVKGVIVPSLERTKAVNVPPVLEDTFPITTPLSLMPIAVVESPRSRKNVVTDVAGFVEFPSQVNEIPMVSAWGMP